MDHVNSLGYVYLQKSLTSAEMVESKKAFEAYARKHGVVVRHCHADTGRFADNAFPKAVAKAGQTIS